MVTSLRLQVVEPREVVVEEQPTTPGVTVIMYTRMTTSDLHSVQQRQLELVLWLQKRLIPHYG